MPSSIQANVVELKLGVALDDQFDLRELASAASVEFSGRLSVKRRRSAAYVIPISRTVTCLVACALGGRDLVLSVTSASGVADIPVSGLVVIVGADVTGMALSGYGEVEILALAEL